MPTGMQEEVRVARAIRRFAERSARFNAPVRLYQATIVTANPLAVEMPRAAISLESDVLLVTESVRSYDTEYGLQPGDTVLVVSDGEDMIVLAVLAAESMADVWRAATLAGAWVAFGAPSQVAEYRRDPLRIVRLRGAIKSGTGLILTLPTGYRPAATEHFVCPITTASAEGSARVTVAATGAVTLVGASVAGALTLLSLSGITFEAV